MTDNIILILWIFWTISLLIFYHKIFSVYYFSLFNGLVKELIGAALLGMLMVAITLYVWWVIAIIIIILGFSMAAKTSNKGWIYAAAIFAVFIAFAGIYFRLDKDTAEEAVTMQPTEDNEFQETADNEWDYGEMSQENDPYFFQNGSENYSNEIDAETGFQSQTRTNYSQWEDIYQRDHGPASTVWIETIDDEGITFTASIGASGYMAYVDIREYFAAWMDEHTACYIGDFNYILYIMLNDDGSISLEDSQPFAETLSLSGTYTRESEASFPDCEFVFSNSSYDYISYGQCAVLNEVECKIARNEIYARHGRKFADESLQGYFDVCSWYEGTIEAEDFNESILNEYELENLSTITEYEKQMGYR